MAKQSTVAKRHAEFVRVLEEERITHPSNWREQPTYVEAQERYIAALRVAHARDAGWKGHVHSHSEPSHHVGSCGDSCRRGTAVHLHRRSTRRGRNRA